MKKTSVRAKDGENINQLLRRFKKVTSDSGKLEEFKDNMFYTKPTTERKNSAGAAKSRNRKRVALDQLPSKPGHQVKK
jgi:ribosomal protein S21